MSSVLPLKSPEFIFPVERKKKSWNEKMFDRTGTSYLAGMDTAASCCE